MGARKNTYSCKQKKGEEPFGPAVYTKRIANFPPIL
jgi:hypothetical protein